MGTAKGAERKAPGTMTWNEVRELTDDQLDDLHELFQGEWWTHGRSRRDIEQMVEHSDEVVGIVDSRSGSLVAFARALSDYTYKALVFDVIVTPDHRGNGLGARVMEALLTRPALEGVRHFELYCRADMIEFYDRWGFSGDVDGVQLLRRESRDDLGSEK